MKCRKNVADLTVAEKSQLVQAFLDLKNPVRSPGRIPAAATRVTAGGGTPNRYDDYVWLHNTVAMGAHRGPAFGPWHREFLHQLEFDLQQVSGDPNLTLPYWDWTTARSSASPGWPFTNDLMGGFGSSGPGVTTGVVTSGPFSDPRTWRINIRRRNDPDLRLKRSNGIPDGDQLPSRDDALHGLGVGVPAGAAWPSIYDAAPWDDMAQDPTDAQILGAFRKYLERLLHDFVHVWIGGYWDFDAQGQPTDGGHMTFPAVAVNDPVFWLHHSNVDRMWSIWQRKAPSSGYLPQVPGTAPAGHNGNDLMANLSNPAWFNAPRFPRPNDVQHHHDLGYWFRTDLPQVTLETPSVDFGTVPELQTIERPLTFTVRTCQPVRFELLSVTGAHFSAPTGQGTIEVADDPGTDTVTAQLSVRFEASGSLSVPQSGTATVRASILDADGYDASAPGGEITVGTWTVDLVATPAPRPVLASPVLVSPDADRIPPIPVDAEVATGEGPMIQEESASMADASAAATEHPEPPSGDIGAGEVLQTEAQPVHENAPDMAMAGEGQPGHGGMDHGHGGHIDHEALFFRPWKRTDDGRVVVLPPDEIGRDTSGFVDGHDPGVGPDPLTSSGERAEQEDQTGQDDPAHRP